MIKIKNKYNYIGDNHYLKTCPLCSTEIDAEDTCSKACPAYRSSDERMKHLKFIKPELFGKDD